MDGSMEIFDLARTVSTTASHRLSTSRNSWTTARTVCTTAALCLSTGGNSWTSGQSRGLTHGMIRDD
ncbi:hypothetical protein J6590_107768 [Homalodisca vitripennis]|nr:hypothetical protein J6590_107768 [Homalodisca vitripennis]